MTFTVTAGRVTIGCPCGYQASGHQPVAVMDAVKDHETFAHGKGVSLQTFADLRAYADR